ncbi:MAG: pantoate--beta-alanine ligase [Chloroflexi bacterium]|nr:pantoate--beta-alanine ligase [Chloroflexota bacterium]
MQIIHTISDFKNARRRISGTVGFVPTMGYLHEGHLSLARRAKADNDVAVASIFVNPTQFGRNEDFSKYPRDLARDVALLEREGTDIVFAPEASDMYPEGFATYIDIEGPLTTRLEGAVRPGHFKGVATVVAKLFNIVQPTRAYFGQKDAQQVLVIQKLVSDLNGNLDVVVMPTVREPDGLAMSSRNVYLSPQQREAALVLSKALRLAERLYGEGERDAECIRAAMRRLIEAELLARIDYVSVADCSDLAELDVVDRPALVSLAVRIGATRLIDNTPLEVLQ